MTEPTLKLPRNADELLRDFPLEPDFEAQAKLIEARLKGSPGGVVFDDLLRAPELPPESGEPALPSSVRSASAPKSNFAEMARKSLAKGEDDATAAARELLAATAHSRRPNAAMVERMRAAGKAAATPLPMAEPRSERHSGVVPREATPAVPLPVASRPANDQRGVIIGLAGVAVAIAACLALYLKSSEPAVPATAALAAQQAPTTPVVAEAHAVTPAQVPAAKPEDGVLSPEALAAVPNIRNAAQ